MEQIGNQVIEMLARLTKSGRPSRGAITIGETQIKQAGDGAFLPGQALSLPLATARLPLASAAIKLIAVVILITLKVRFDKAKKSPRATAVAKAEPTS